MAHAFDIINPVELSAFIRALDPTTYGFTLNEFLPDQTREDVEYAFNRVDERREDVAPYRAFDVEAAIGSRPGFARVKGQIPPLSKKLPITEEQRLRLDGLRGSDVGRRIADEVFDDAALLTEALLARIEQARGQALTTAIVTFTADPGIAAGVTVDYTIGGANPITVGTAAAGGLWTVPANGKPITDLLQWSRDWSAANGGKKGGTFVTQQANIDAAMLCAEVTTALYPSAGLGVQFPTVSDLNRFIAARGGLPVRAYDTQVSVAGVATDVIPNNKVYLWPMPNKANFGETTFGVTAEALDAVQAGYDTLATAPGLYGIVDRTFDPIQTWTKVSGIALPVLKDPKKILASPNVR